MNIFFPNIFIKPYLHTRQTFEKCTCCIFVVKTGTLYFQVA